MLQISHLEPIHETLGHSFVLLNKKKPIVYKCFIWNNFLSNLLYLCYYYRNFPLCVWCSELVTVIKDFQIQKLFFTFNSNSSDNGKLQKANISAKKLLLWVRLQAVNYYCLGDLRWHQISLFQTFSSECKALLSWDWTNRWVII